MQCPGWITFLRGVPAAYQRDLSLVTLAGNEIAVQSVLHVADDYLVIRGRVTGTTDSGNFFMVPLERVAYVGFAKGLKEQDMAALFSVALPADAQSAPTPTDVAPDATPATAAAAAGGLDSGPPTNGPPARPVSVDKSGLLERLRARRSLTDYPRASGP